MNKQYKISPKQFKIHLQSSNKIKQNINYLIRGQSKEANKVVLYITFEIRI